MKSLQKVLRALVKGKYPFREKTRRPKNEIF